MLRYARQYLEGMTSEHLGEHALDAVQPNVEFAFGAQPAATRDKDVFEAGKRRKKVGVVGAGDVFNKFILPTLAQRGTEIYIADPGIDAASGHKKSEVAAKSAQAIGAKAHTVENIQAMPDDLDYVLILTPPASHKTLIVQAMEKGVPVAVEKPLAASKQDAEELDKLLQEKQHPLYCIDWEVMHALPLLHAAGVNVPFTDMLEMENAERFKQFDFRNLKKVDARFVEGGDNSLGDLEKVKRDRPWLFDYTKGGGILYDMAVHPLNVLAALGLKNAGIEEVYLGSPTDEKGVYTRFGKEEAAAKTGEIYGRVHMRMDMEGGNRNIETVIEAAKNAKESDGQIVLEDNDGNTLRWEMFPKDKTGKPIPGSKLELFDVGGSLIATSSIKADCYSLIIQDICNFVGRTHKTAEKPALYFPEHRDMICAIDEMHQIARSQAIPAGEKVSQLKILENHSAVPHRMADVSIADRKLPKAVVQ